MHTVVQLVMLALVGVAFGRHYGVLEGFAAFSAVYLIMPWQPMGGRR